MKIVVRNCQPAAERRFPKLSRVERPVPGPADARDERRSVSSPGGLSHFLRTRYTDSSACNASNDPEEFQDQCQKNGLRTGWSAGN